MPTINFLLGDYSELFMLLAAGTYVVAFLAFAWDMATSGKVAQQDAARLADAAREKAAAAAAVKEPALADISTAVSAEKEWVGLVSIAGPR